MQNPFVPAVGGVLSADIAVPDHAKEVAFYHSILTTGDNPLWRDDLMNNLGKPVIGLGARIPAYEKLPLQWMPHFQVADIANSVDAAIEMGGTELMHSKAADGKSQWAVMTDADGAAFGLIPVVNASDYPGLSDRQGKISWLSLIVPNAEKSRDFYMGVIGWSSEAEEEKGEAGASNRILMQIDSETSAAEIIESHETQSEIPAVWMMHLPVGDFEESLRRVKVGGGKVIQESTLSKDAIICDPIGVYLALTDYPA